MKDDFWFKSEDGGKVWQRFDLPPKASGFYEKMKALHSGWLGRPVLPWVHDAAAVVLVLLVATGIRLYFR